MSATKSKAGAKSNAKKPTKSKSTRAQSNSKSSSRSNAQKKQPQKRSLSSGNHQQREPEMRKSLLSERMRNDLIGIVLIAVSIILIVAVTMPGDAVVTNWLNKVLHYAVGIGTVILPFFIALFGICFFFLGRRELVLPRIALGLAIIFVAIIALFGINAPDVVEYPDYLFGPAYLYVCGGYLGNGIAYALIKLVGQIIAWVLMAAAIIAGLVLIGFSISGLVDWIMDRKDAHKEDEFEFTAPYSRARGQQEMASGTGDGFVPATQMINGGKAGKTKFLGRKKAAAATQVLNPESDMGKTVVIDPDDEVLQGRTRTQGSGLLTRKLDGADELVDDESTPEESVVPAIVPDVLEEAAQSKGRGKKQSKQKEAEAPVLLADMARVEAPEGGYSLPDPKMLRKSVIKANTRASEADLSVMAGKLQDTLQEFSVDADVVGWVHGPTVTLFKVSLASGVKVSKITSLSDDIALAFAAQAVRIFSPIAGTSLVGIEIPNDTRDNVLLGDVLPPAGNKPLLMAIGKDVEGNPITADLSKMPHLLIGGTTGSGKSVSINSMIMSVLMRATPDEVRMILIDPKRVELSLYNDIPHLFVPVVTDPHKAASTLAWAVAEMERRLKLFEEYAARNIAQYNKMAEQWAIDHERKMSEKAAAEEVAKEAQEAQAAELSQESDAVEGEDGEYEVVIRRPVPATATKFEDEDDDDEEMVKLPAMMIVIDELADLMMVAGKEVETSISRIAQLGRAAGIHMIVATQRPSTNVITGLIKANITNRIAFNVASGIDSRVILDSTGAEHLVGLGDLLFSKPELGKPMRIQGCFVGEDEINTVCKYLRKQGKPDYHEDIFATAIPVMDNSGSGIYGGGGDDDSLLWEAADIVVSSNLGSTSALQRRLKVGYARAGRIMDMLEDKGIVGPANGSKPRDVLVDDMELENIKAMVQNDVY